MKEKTSFSGSSHISMLACATEDERFVAQILLDLPNILVMAESGSVFKWGCKKRRSRFDDSSIFTSFRKNDVKIEGRQPQPKAAEESVAAATSPVTPLAFSPSESDRKSTHPPKRTSQKRSREKYTSMIKELTQRRDLLTEEIGNVTNYYNKLIAYNSQLKAMKQQVLNSFQKNQEPQLEISRYGNIGKEFRQHHHEISLGQPQPLVLDQMAEIIRLPVGPNAAQLSNGLEVGPLGIPDLNISAEEAILSSQITDRRSRFAEARRRRKDIIKIKIMKSACGGNKFPRAR